MYTNCHVMWDTLSLLGYLEISKNRGLSALILISTILKFSAQTLILISTILKFPAQTLILISTILKFPAQTLRQFQQKSRKPKPKIKKYD